MALPEGTYDVEIFPENVSYKDTVIQNIDVTAGSDTDIGLIELSTN